jgi:hypothetical protein
MANQMELVFSGGARKVTITDCEFKDLAMLLSETDLLAESRRHPDKTVAEFAMDVFDGHKYGCVEIQKCRG